MTDWLKRGRALATPPADDPYGDPVADRAKAFYAHLDVCQQCREQPFALCGVGATLLVAIAPRRTA